jgi:hypothetical protein
MDIKDIIFRLLHISNLPSLVVLTPPHSPCTPFVNCVHFFANYVNSSINYDNTSTDCINFFVDYVNKFVNYKNMPKDWANLVVDSIDTYYLLINFILLFSIWATF